MVVRLIDGKSGKPMKNKNVSVAFCPDCLRDFDLRTGSDGAAHVKIPNRAKTVFLRVGHKDGKEPNRIAYQDCNKYPLSEVSVEEIMHRGFSSENNCGVFHIPAKAAEVIFWAHSIPWWQPTFQ
jgi:hypothetical protein